MNLGAPELIILLLFAALFAALPIWGIIDAAIRPDSVWKSADQSKVLWVVLQIFLGVIGAMIYLIAIRPKLRAVS